jgi:hypothetical protein
MGLQTFIVITDFHSALAFVGVCSWATALADVSHSITVDASRADVFILRAKLHWRLDEAKKGNADFKKAHSLDPDHPEVKFTRQQYTSTLAYIFLETFVPHSIILIDGDGIQVLIFERYLWEQAEDVYASAVGCLLRKEFPAAVCQPISSRSLTLS